MSEYRISVDKVGYDVKGSPVVRKPQSPPPSAPAPAASPGARPLKAESQPEPEKTAHALAQQGDVFLRFKVDEDKHDITVFVVDRSSRKVVRTIPPEEMSNLQAGDLVELLA